MPKKPDELNERQKRFVDEYMVDGNASAAYRRAGYTQKNADVQGPRLLGNAGIQTELDRRKALVAKKIEARTGLSMEYVRREWEKITSVNLWQIVKRGEDGKPIVDKRGWFEIDWTQMTEEMGAAIAEIAPDGRVKFYSKEAVLRDIARHLGGFQKDAPQVTLALSLEQLINMAGAPAVKTIEGKKE